MSDGRLALTFDDGYATDYEDIYPVLDDRDAPASLAVVADWLGEEGHLSVEQLRELADDGWEVVAHGRKHRYLQAHGLAADASAGDERLLLDSDHAFPEADHGLYPEDTFEVTDGERTETVTLAEKGVAAGDAGDPFVRFEAPLGSSFDAEEAVFRPTREQIRDEIEGSKRDLQELGFEPTTFALPYDAADARVWGVVAEHFEALADAAVRSLPNPPGASPLDLQRYYLETDAMRLAEIETYLDGVAERGGLGILAGHTAWDTVPPERVAAVVDAAHERGIEVTTVREAVESDADS
ncbi:polysaccharide deacetylase family protein [Halosimplex aquaticum]|uniref:Polysaccharide deacetylase family protein n=1 Tax=Halosimplex aquaticum TaxID=3026162 RepID=A0ABD5Y0Q2_9EURY|nr:polysaccharide deacetylase family protein [Halosimplex aquaticum]